MQSRFDAETAVAKKAITLGPDHMWVAKEQYSADLDLAQQYQKFTEELLRLGLIGIGVLAFFFDKIAIAVYFSADHKDWLLRLIALAAALFAMSGAYALRHRFLSATGVGWHIEFLRHANAGNEDKVSQKRVLRNADYRIAFRSLNRARILCGLAVAVLAAALVVAVVSFDATRLKGQPGASQTAMIDFIKHTRPA